MSNTISLSSREARLNHLLDLQGASFRLEPVEVFKNNALVSGFSLKGDNSKICPNLYMDDVMMEKSDSELLDLFFQVYEESQKKEFDASALIHPEYILSHVYPRLYADTNASAMASHGLSYEILPDTGLLVGWYLKVSDSKEGSATVNLSDRILKEAGLSVSDVRKSAIESMEKVSYVSNLSAFLSDALGMDMDTGDGLYLVSNHTHLFGASAILCPSIIKNLQGLLGKQFYILPASIHETLCLAYTENSRDALYEMVCEINGTQVSEIDRLLDGVLLYNGEKLVSA